MNNRNYTYSLERPKRDKGVLCPNCNTKRYKLYRDANGEKLDDTVGRCERINSCNYHKPPRVWFDEHPELSNRNPDYTPPNPDRIKDAIVAATIGRYETNALFRYLSRLFDENAVRAVFERYKVGTTKDGRTTFWMHDRDGVCRSGKVMLYDGPTGKRNRDVRPEWAHEKKLLNIENFEVRRTLFGAHLVPGSALPVGVVESEKTALVCALARPDRLWVATGGASHLPGQHGEGVASKVAVLSGRAVELYPDLDHIDDWADRAVFLSRYLGALIQVAAWWEDAAEPLDDQADIADLILQQLNAPPPEPEPPAPPPPPSASDEDFAGPPGWDDPLAFYTKPAKTCAPGEKPDWFFDDVAEPEPPPEPPPGGDDVLSRFIAKNQALGYLVKAFDLYVDTTPQAPLKYGTDWPLIDPYESVPIDAPAELHELAAWGKAHHWRYQSTEATVGRFVKVRNMRGVFEARLLHAAQRQWGKPVYAQLIGDMKEIQKKVGI